MPLFSPGHPAIYSLSLRLPNENTHLWLALTIYFQAYPGKQELIKVMLAERGGRMDEFIKLKMLA